jgi:hypothetical protein
MAKKPNSDERMGNPFGHALPMIFVDDHSSLVMGVKVSFHAPNFHSICQLMERINRPEQHSCESVEEEGTNSADWPQVMSPEQ